MPEHTKTPVLRQSRSNPKLLLEANIVIGIGNKAAARYVMEFIVYLKHCYVTIKP